MAISKNGVFASGSNSDGSYMKLPDGTMIEWGTRTARTGSTAVTGYPTQNPNKSVYLIDTDFNFPVAFYSKPMALAGGSNYVYGTLSTDAGITTASKCHITGYHNAANTDISFAWFALGRWKA